MWQRQAGKQQRSFHWDLNYNTTFNCILKAHMGGLVIDRDKDYLWLVKTCMISFPSSFGSAFTKSHPTSMCCVTFIIETFDILNHIWVLNM